LRQLLAGVGWSGGWPTIQIGESCG
jgi:hypothetical protein